MKTNIVSLLVLLFAVSTAQAQIMAEHVGLNDPNDQTAAYWRSPTHPYYGWAKNGDPGGSADPNSFPASWSMVKTYGSPSMIGAYYSNQVHRTTDSPPYNFDQFLHPAGWVATIYVKVNFAKDIAHANIFYLEDSQNIFDLHVINDPHYLLVNGLHLRKWVGPGVNDTDWNHIDPTATASNWTLFNIVCDAKGDTNTANDEFSIYVNGVQVGSTYPRSYFQTTGNRNFSFGRTATASRRSDQQYALWRLEFGNTLPFPIAGDVDGDLWVGNKDLNLIIKNWGNNYPAGDFVDDNVIDEKDYQIVIDNWGTGFNSPAGIPVSMAPTPLLDNAESDTNIAALGFLLGGVLLIPARRRRSKQTLLSLLLTTVVLFYGQSVFAAGEFAQHGSGKGNAPASWGDFDRDGDPDLFSGHTLMWTNTDTDPYFWTDEPNGWDDAVNSLWGDINNDGYLDFYSSHENKVYMNSSGTVSKTGISLSAVTSSDNAKIGPCFADFDNNGYIDLYIASHYQFGAAQPDALLMNDGFGGWTTTGEEGSLGDALPVATTYEGRGATSCDFDRDGDQDIYVSNYGGNSGFRMANYLWVNDGTGNFTESAAAYGVDGWDGSASSFQWSIGSVWADFDNDGEFDLLAGAFNHHGASNENKFQLLKNGGSGAGYTFTNQGNGGISTGRHYASPSAADYDNDGDLDLYISIFNYGGATGKSALYRNDGNFTFTEIANSGLDEASANYQGAWADYDNDGDMDIIANAAPRQNLLNNSNHYLKFRVIGNGTTVNSDGIGTQVRISVDHDNNGGTPDIIVTRQVEAGTGSGGNQSDMTLHFGLGLEPDSTVDLDIVWPDGNTETVSGVPVDSLFILDKTITIQTVAGAPAGYTAYDIAMDTTTKIGSIEMTVQTDSPGDIYQVSLLDDPDVSAAADGFDTYVTLGTAEVPTGANPSSTRIIGHAEAINPNSSLVFDDQNINITWAWDSSVVDLIDFSIFAANYDALDFSDLVDFASRWLTGYTLDAGEYQIARIILKDTATNAKITVVGMETGSQAFIIKIGP
jgi:hypothetical protein